MSVFEGDVDRAHGNIEKLLTTDRTTSVSSLKRSLYILKDQAFLKRYLDALRKAGLPEG